MIGKKNILAYNGEIYNTEELEKLLGRKNYSDTELLSELLTAFGIRAIKRIKGEFAFAFFADKTLFLARDRLGVKPLYYYNSGKILYFSSEIKALIRCLESLLELNPLELGSYVKPYGDYTPIKEIKQVLPGHFIKFQLKAGKVFSEQKKYSEISSRTAICSGENAREKIRKTLKNAVESMMVSDTKIGLLLSGGIDSTILAFVMSQLTDKTIPAFSVGSSEVNEFEDAEIVANEFGLNLKIIEMNEDDIVKSACNVVKKLETYDSGPFPTAVAMDKLFSEIDVKVVLSGEGADELFGGYEEAFSILNEKTPNYLLFESQILNATKCMYQRQLARLDKISLSHSIEARVPFLHSDFVDLALSIDSRLKFRKGREKAILFDAFKDIFPERIRKKHKERFGVAAGTKAILEKNFGNLELFTKEKFQEAYCRQNILEVAL